MRMDLGFLNSLDWKFAFTVILHRKYSGREIRTCLRKKIKEKVIYIKSEVYLYNVNKFVF